MKSLPYWQRKQPAVKRLLVQISYWLGAGGKAEITDDTQMTMFTAEGVLCAQIRFTQRGICHVPSMVHRSYLLWLHTQGYPKPEGSMSWLSGIPELNQKRAPGNTCLTALMSGEMGTIEEPINDSKGCGGVMRVAPIGLLCQKEAAFQLGCECAALTHGHPSGYLPAGVLAHIIASLIEGTNLEDSVLDAMRVLKTYSGHEECTGALEKAVEFSRSKLEPSEAIRRIGLGWVGEEALGIAVYCALKYRYHFPHALIVSVNHDGDSDSTGAIAGNILGTYLGFDQLPKDWVEKVELGNILIELADDLLTGYEDSVEWKTKYPVY